MGKKKIKGVAVESDAKARQRRADLMQDYEELQKEADSMRSKLEVAKQKRLLLAAEVRFLRRKHRQLMKANNTNFSQERIDMGTTSLKQAKNTKGRILVGNEASQCRFPTLLDSRPNKKRCTDHKQRLQALALILEKERGVSGLALTHSIGDFELNQRNNSSRQEASLPNRAPTFDLNEISTGDEDLDNNNVEVVKFEEAKKSLMMGMNNEQQNDLKFSVCRNAREGSTHVAKRKISWQDPVALRV